MTGEDFFLVVSAGTRQQVSFILEGKGLGLKKGATCSWYQVIDKATGWGGKIGVELFEPRPPSSAARA